MPIETIYFDTNILYSLNRPKCQLRDICNEAGHYGIGLFVGEPSISELATIWSEEFKKALGDLELFSLSNVNRPIVAVPECKEIRKSIEIGITDILDDLQIVPVAVHQSINLPDLLDRACKRQAPFQEKDKGFRDAVILDSVILHAATRAGNSVFFSKDKVFTQATINQRVQQLKVTARIVTVSSEDAVMKLIEEAGEAFVIEYKARIEASILKQLEYDKETVFSFVKTLPPPVLNNFLGLAFFSRRESEDGETDCDLTYINTVGPCNPLKITGATFLPGISQTEGENQLYVAWVKVLSEYAVTGGRIYSVAPSEYLFGRSLIPDGEGVFHAEQREMKSDFSASASVRRIVTIRAELKAANGAFTDTTFTDELLNHEAPPTILAESITDSSE